MTEDLATKFQEKIDERFSTESKSSLVTNREYDFIGARSIKIYNVGTAPMNDYGRNKKGTSRYGEPENLSAEAEEYPMEKDRSFTFTIDKADEDETLGALNAGKALARQIREVVEPEVDKYTYEKMARNAGKTEIQTASASNAYDLLTDANEELDNNEVPVEGRVAVCTPAYHKFLKKDKNAVIETEIGQDMKIRGVVANLDGAVIQKVPKKLLPDGANFILAHAVATTQAVKLAEYKIHTNAPGVSGQLVEGRIYYTAFIRKNKKGAIYYCTSKALPEQEVNTNANSETDSETGPETGPETGSEG